MKELKLKKSEFSESQSYPVLKANFLESLDSTLTPAEKREALEGFKEGFNASQGLMPNWFEGMPDFLTPEYRIHPLMGHQVRSRHVFIPEGSTQAERLAEKVHVPRAHPKVIPYDLDPEYRDKGESEHGEADLKGVKQYPVKLTPEPIYPEPSFDHIKSARLRRSVEILELKIGYDHRTNKHVLYSPLKYNKRWDQQSQVIWLRVIGMSPIRIGVKLKVKIDTVKNWLRVLKGQELVALSQYDWAIRQIEGQDTPQLATPFSSTEAKLRTPAVIPIDYHGSRRGEE